MKKIIDFLSLSRPVDVCWEWDGYHNESGYGVLNTSGKILRVHRLAWEFHNSKKIPDGLYVCHSCDNPPCCNPAHLFLGTPKDNMHDKERKGRGKPPPKNDNSGSKHGMSKLTEIEALEIKKSIQPIKEIAAKFRMSFRQIRDIRSGAAWKHL